MTAERPGWLLPRGVPSGVWDYAASEHIADQYDDLLAGDALFAFDQRILAEYVRQGDLVVDFGCGTGRSLAPLLAAGCRGLGVDLSYEMLGLSRAKAEGIGRGDQLCTVRANLVETGWIGRQPWRRRLLPVQHPRHDRRRSKSRNGAATDAANSQTKRAAGAARPQRLVAPVRQYGAPLLGRTSL